MIIGELHIPYERNRKEINMSEVALQIIGTIGEELQMARDEISDLKKALEDARSSERAQSDSASYWYKQYS